MPWNSGKTWSPSPFLYSPIYFSILSPFYYYVLGVIYTTPYLDQNVNNMLLNQNMLSYYNSLHPIGEKYEFSLRENSKNGVSTNSAFSDKKHLLSKVCQWLNYTFNSAFTTQRRGVFGLFSLMCMALNSVNTVCHEGNTRRLKPCSVHSRRELKHLVLVSTWHIRKWITET